VHLSVDEHSPEGNIYIKCPTISTAMSALNSLNGRYFAGKMIKANYIPLITYHQKFPDSINSMKVLTPSSE
jgi:RNA-binding protein 23/39